MPPAQPRWGAALLALAAAIPVGILLAVADGLWL